MFKILYEKGKEKTSKITLQEKHKNQIWRYVY